MFDVQSAVVRQSTVGPKYIVLLCSSWTEDSLPELHCTVVQECGPLTENGMVMNVLDHSFDVLVLKLGVMKRVYVEVTCLFTLH